MYMERIQVHQMEMIKKEILEVEYHVLILFWRLNMQEKNKNLIIRSSAAEFLIFEQQKQEKGIEVRFEDGDLWLTQKLLGELYDTTRNNITMHIQNIFADGELEEKSVSKKFLLTASDGKSYNTNYYNLDMIISVGYRVSSDRAIRV